MAQNTWGLALNGSRARIVRDLENRHDERGIPEELALEIRPKHLRDVMTDKPGRSFSSAGAGRSAMEYASDPVAEEKKAFCAEVQELLEQHLHAGDFKRLVVSASPEMLGIFRDLRSAAIAEATVREVDKDLLHEDRKGLRHLLQAMVTPRGA